MLEEGNNEKIVNHVAYNDPSKSNPNGGNKAQHSGLENKLKSKDTKTLMDCFVNF